MRWSGVIVLLVMLAGCARVPESYPPPMQRKPLPGLEEGPSGMVVSMSDANAEAYFVRDISPALEGGRWRWTNARPELKLYLPDTKSLKLVWEFSIVPVTFEQTGPVTVSFFVNQKLVGRVACPAPGEYKFEQPVLADLLKLNDFNRIAAQADKLWVSPTDGAKLGFTMTRAGFLK